MSEAEGEPVTLRDLGRGLAVLVPTVFIGALGAIGLVLALTVEDWTVRLGAFFLALVGLGGFLLLTAVIGTIIRLERDR